MKQFFNHLKFDAEGEPVVDIISYGKLMSLVNFNERWVYKGSVTTPPCDKNVYWNVMRRVFPIEPETLALFKAKLVAN